MRSNKSANKGGRKGLSKAQLLREHGRLFTLKLEGKVSDLDLSADSRRLEDMGIPFSRIIIVRQEALDRFNRNKKKEQEGERVASTHQNS